LERLRAQFQYGLSISSVKVVRHKREEFFCGRLWESLAATSDLGGMWVPRDVSSE
jgi:hypothetical protein